MPSPGLSSAAPAGTFNVCAQAERVAADAARRAGVTVCEIEDVPRLREVPRLLEAVWGRTTEGVPLGSDLLRSLVHADGCVTVAYDAHGELVGSAALMRAAEPTTYSLIAAAAPGRGDRGVGLALKLRQRAWALARGQRAMVWTFDPLVSRNARFNLAKLGATAVEYETAFYGRMDDALNGADEADRLVARWDLDSRRAVAATEGTLAEPRFETGGPAEVVNTGPDGRPLSCRSEDRLWCRIPLDIVALRRTDAAQASRWREAVRAVLTPEVGRGRTVTHLTRDGWYLLEVTP